MGSDLDPGAVAPTGVASPDPPPEDGEPRPSGETRFYVLFALGLAVAVGIGVLLAGLLGGGGAAAAPSPSAPRHHSPSTHGSPTPSPPEQNAETRFFVTDGKGYPTRWNPCQPIHWVVNLDAAPRGALPSVLGAIARVSKATGIDFVFDGQTQTSPTIQVTSQMRTPWGTWRPLLIAWGPRDLILKFTDPNHMLAVGVPRPGFGPTAHEFVSGVVIVNAAQPIPNGFGTRWSLGVVLMHELGHVMGLAHVPSGHELMWSPMVDGATLHPDPRQNTYGTGDRAGLSAVGRDAGCLPMR